MKTQKQILAELLSEISGLKLMVQRIHGYVVEIQDKESRRLQTEVDILSKPATLTVNEDQECMEYDKSSIHLDRQERLLINGGVYFCIRGEDLYEKSDDFKMLMIWEFNNPKEVKLITNAVCIGKDGKEDEHFRDCVYEGEIHQHVLKEDK
jgi:hypothetical protein